MLARVKWTSDRWDGHKNLPEHGTLLGFVSTAQGIVAMIACDGHDQSTRGKIIRRDYERVTVTTWFNWMGEGHVPGLRGVGSHKAPCGAGSEPVV